MNGEDVKPGGTPEQPASPAPKKKGSMGWLVTIIIIIILIILGISLGKKAPKEVLPEADEIVQQLEEQGTSDELGAIEEDLGTTDLEDLDLGLEELDAL